MPGSAPPLARRSGRRSVRRGGRRGGDHGMRKACTS